MTNPLAESRAIVTTTAAAAIDTSVHAAPPERYDLPAGILTEADQFLTPDTFSSWTVGWSLIVIARPADNMVQIDWLDQAITDLLPALAAEGLGASVGPYTTMTTADGQPVLTATVTISDTINL